MPTDNKIHKVTRGFSLQALDSPDGKLKCARAIIAAYNTKLRAGVELPEPDTDEPASNYFGKPCFYTEETLKQYGDARDQAGYLRGLETALIKVTGLSVDVERCKQLQLTTQAWEDALDTAAAAIEKLRGGE